MQNLHRESQTLFFHRVFFSHGGCRGTRELYCKTVTSYKHTNLLHIKLVKIVIKFVLLLIKKVLNHLPKIFQGIQNIVFHAYLSTGKGSQFHVCALYFNESDERKYFLRHRKNMASLKEIVIMYQSLKREWDKKPPNLDRCGDFLTKLKVCIQ